MTKVEGPNVALTARPVDMAWPHGLALARQGREIIELSVAESASLGGKERWFLRLRSATTHGSLYSGACL